MDARIARELELLRDGGQAVEFFDVADRRYVVYREVPTRAQLERSDVIVPVPSGYPAAMIDLAGLPVGSPLLPRVKGGANSQGIVTVAGTVASVVSPEERFTTTASTVPPVRVTVPVDAGFVALSAKVAGSADRPSVKLGPDPPKPL